MTMPLLTHAPEVPPLDAGNPVLAPVAVLLDLDRIDLEPGEVDRPGLFSVFSAQVNMADGRTGVQVACLTIRNATSTMTAFWEPGQAREYVQELRDHISREMPIIILPPSVVADAGPDRRRLVVSLDDACWDYSTRASITMTAETGATLADRLDGVLAALSGLVLPS